MLWIWGGGLASLHLQHTAFNCAGGVRVDYSSQAIHTLYMKAFIYESFSSTHTWVHQDIAQSQRGPTTLALHTWVDRDIVQSRRGGAMQRELPALLLCNGPVGSSGGGMCGKYYNSNEELDEEEKHSEETQSWIAHFIGKE